MIARGRGGSAQAQLRDGQQQQRDADKLQQQREGCWMRRRRVVTVGCAAAVQKRNVETTSLRRERSSR